MSMRSITPWSSCSLPIGISVATTWGPKAPLSESSVRKKSERSRSSMFTKTVRASPSSEARSQSRLVVTSTPITPFTTKTAPSTTRNAASASAAKLGSPGVSIRLILRSSQRNDERLAEIDISRAFSSEAESDTVVPSATEPSRLMAPASNRSASFTDVLPLPRWPTNATLRILFGDSCAIRLPSPSRCEGVRLLRKEGCAAPGAAAGAAGRGRTAPRWRRSRGSGSRRCRARGRTPRSAWRRAAAPGHRGHSTCRPRRRAGPPGGRRGARRRSRPERSCGPLGAHAPAHRHGSAAVVALDAHLVHQLLDDAQPAPAVLAALGAPTAEVANRRHDLVAVKGDIDLVGGVAGPVGVLDGVARGFADRERELVVLGIRGARAVEEAGEPPAQARERAGLRGQGQADPTGRHRQRPHGEDRHVVAQLALAENGLEHALAEAAQLLVGRAHGRGELAEPLVEGSVAAFHEPVGVEQQRRAGLDHRGLLAEHGGVGGPDWDRAPAFEEARPVGPDHERRRVAGRAEGDLARLALEHEVQHRRHDLLDAAHDEPVDPGDHLGWRRLDHAVGAERVAELAHRRGGAEPVARDIAHDERHTPVRALQYVVPVTSDRRAARAGEVPRSHLDTLDRGQPLRQQAALERLGDRVLLPVDLEQAPLHGLPLVDVDCGADVAHEPAPQVAGDAAVRDPAVAARAVIQPVFALPGAPLGERLLPGGEGELGVLGVHPEVPALPHFLLERRAGEAQPALVHERHEAGLVGGPDHGRGGGGQPAEAPLPPAERPPPRPAPLDIRGGAPLYPE